MLDKIFVPNIPTQKILTDVGSNLVVIELIKYFLNPIPNPNIYIELGDGLIKNYGVLILIDSSISCFGGESLFHLLQTIKILLNALNIIELSCFDLIMQLNQIKLLYVIKEIHLKYYLIILKYDLFYFI